MKKKLKPKKPQPKPAKAHFKPSKGIPPSSKAKGAQKPKAKGIVPKLPIPQPPPPTRFDKLRKRGLEIRYHYRDDGDNPKVPIPEKITRLSISQWVEAVREWCEERREEYPTIGCLSRLAGSIMNLDAKLFVIETNLKEHQEEDKIIQDEFKKANPNWKPYQRKIYTEVKDPLVLEEIKRFANHTPKKESAIAAAPEKIVETKAGSKVVTAASEGKQGGKRFMIYGYPITAILRWMGVNNWRKEDAAKAMKKLDLDVSANTIKAQISAGKNGERGDPAKLTPEQERALSELIGENKPRKQSSKKRKVGK